MAIRERRKQQQRLREEKKVEKEENLRNEEKGDDDSRPADAIPDRRSPLGVYPVSRGHDDDADNFLCTLSLRRRLSQLVSLLRRMAHVWCDIGGLKKNIESFP